MECLSKSLELLEFAVFDRPTHAIVNTIVMSKMHELTFEVLRTRWFVDTSDNPALWLLIEDPFDFRVVIKCHVFYSIFDLIVFIFS